MISRIHDKLGTAGFVVAIVALVAALSGVAVAAGGGGLNGKQKKEVKKIAKQFAGKNGAPGATGPAGATGPKGATGATGATGTPGTPGKDGVDGEDGVCSASQPICVAPSKATMTGDWAFVSTDPEFGFQISYPLRLATAPTTVEWVEVTSPTTACKGIGQAAAGTLCIYMENNAPTGGNFNPVTNFGQTQDPRSGFTAFLSRKVAGESFALGSWAVTAP